MRGRIVKALSGFYYVNTDEGILTCKARGKFRRESCTPLVGDWVEAAPLGGGEGRIDSIEPRRNAFTRPAVANIEQLVIVASEAIPKTEPFLVDRMTAIAALKQCEVLICVNKCDLAPGDDLADYYRRSGFPVLQVSAETGEGTEELKKAISGKLSAFTGNSGVGKSSLLNAVDPSQRLAVGEVSQALGRGRHTTRHVELYALSCGALVIDTPGFSSFDAEELGLALKENLPETFPEFAPFLGECRFPGCSHTKEQGCAILEAARSGKIVPGRLDSYRRLYEELKNLHSWDEKRGR